MAFVAMIKALDQKDGQYGQPFILEGVQSFAQANTSLSSYFEGKGWIVIREAIDLLYVVKPTASGKFEYSVTIVEAEQINLGPC